MKIVNSLYERSTNIFLASLVLFILFLLLQAINYYQRKKVLRFYEGIADKKKPSNELSFCAKNLMKLQKREFIYVIINTYIICVMMISGIAFPLKNGNIISSVLIAIGCAILLSQFVLAWKIWETHLSGIQTLEKSK